MLPYFKKYVIAVCAIAVALPVLASTIWPFATGHIMAASLGGLVCQFVLFLGGLLIGWWVFEQRAERVVDGYLYLYNVDCNPEALLTHGRTLAASITFPCNGHGAWFMGYYAQACLDAGRREEARDIEQGLKESVVAQRKPAQKCAIIVNLIPLVEKTGTLEEAHQLIEEGLELLRQDSSSDAVAQRTYLESQLEVVKARRSQDFAKLLDLDEAVVSSQAYPPRIRVEFAWDAASAAFRLGQGEVERRFLDFVIAHGGTLALVAQAKERLQTLSR